MMDDLELPPINYDKDCKYLNDSDDTDDEQIKTSIKDLITYCVKLRPCTAFYKFIFVYVYYIYIAHLESR